MKNTEQFWVNARTSAMLEELGCESQMDQMGSWSISEIDFSPEQKLFHFSDLLLPENARKVWGEDDVCEASGGEQICETVNTNGFPITVCCCIDRDNNGSCSSTERWRARVDELVHRISYGDPFTDWLHEEVKKALTEKR